MKNTKTLVATWTALSACIFLTPLEAAWGPVEPVSGPISSFQNVGVDNFCRAIATWQQIDESTSEVTNVQSSFLPQGGDWTTPVNIVTTQPDGGPQPIAFPVSVVNPSGYGVSAFTNFDNINQIYIQQAATLQLPGTSWSAPLLTSDSITIIPGINSVSVNRNGFALAFFFSQRDNPSDPDSPFSTFTVTLPKGESSWSTPLQVVKTPHLSIVAVLDQNNNGFVQFQTSPIFGGNVPLLSSELPFGASSWSAPLQITASSVFGGSSLAIDDAGNLSAAWIFQEADQSFSLLSSTLPTGATSWTSPLIVATNVASPVVSPSPNLAVLAPLLIANPITGDLVVIFETIVGGVTIINSSSLPFGGSVWSTPITVSSSLPITDDFFAAPALGIDYCGNAYLAWPNLENGVHVIQASILPPFGNAWTTPVTISDPGTESAFPFISTNGEGYTVVSWINQDENIVEAAVWTPAPTAISSITPDCVGNNVTISGAGFCGIDTVTINGVPAGFDVVSANTITAIVPEGAGAPCTTVDVEIRSGCTAGSVGPVVGQLTLAPSAPRKFVGHIKKEEKKECDLKKEKDKCTHRKECKIKEVKHRKCTLKATWKPSPCANVVKYNIYKGKEIIATIPATSKLEFKTKLHSDCKAKGFSITAVDQFCQESNHVKLKIKH